MKLKRWVGETQFKKYFGLKGFKCLCKLMLDEINTLRQNAGLPQYTLPQVLNKMDVLMTTYSVDEQDAEV